MTIKAFCVTLFLSMVTIVVGIVTFVLAVQYREHKEFNCLVQEQLTAELVDAYYFNAVRRHGPLTINQQPRQRTLLKVDIQFKNNKKVPVSVLHHWIDGQLQDSFGFIVEEEYQRDYDLDWVNPYSFILAPGEEQLVSYVFERPNNDNNSISLAGWPSQIRGEFMYKYTEYNSYKEEYDRLPLLFQPRGKNE